MRPKEKAAVLGTKYFFRKKHGVEDFAFACGCIGYWERLGYCLMPKADGQGEIAFICQLQADAAFLLTSNNYGFIQKKRRKHKM